MKELVSTNNNFLTKANTGRRLSADIQGSIGQNSGHLALMFLFSRQKRSRLKRQKGSRYQRFSKSIHYPMCVGAG